MDAGSGFEPSTRISLFNANGKSIRDLNVGTKPENGYTFDLSGQPDGYYIVKITGTDLNRQFKVLMKK